MNKKGFTLVELLAVIAILAILVIIALPNVLGMFNSAKSSTFVVEVQSIIDQASTQFMTEALKPDNQGKSITFASNNGVAVSGATQLQMSGNTKSYSVVIDRNGNITKVVVVDKNFCYAKTGTSITKTSVVVGDVHDVGSETYASTSCAGATAKN